jgi:WD40 repeat protein
MIWDAINGQRLQVLEGHLGPVNSVSFAPSEKYLVAAGTSGRLQFWDFKKGETFLYHYDFGSGAWLDLLPDGGRASSLSPPATPRDAEKSFA